MSRLWIQTLTIVAIQWNCKPPFVIKCQLQKQQLCSPLDVKTFERNLIGFLKKFKICLHIPFLHEVSTLHFGKYWFGLFNHCKFQCLNAKNTCRNWNCQHVKRCAFVLFFCFPKNMSNFEQKIVKKKIAGNTLANVSQTIYMIIDDAFWRILTQIDAHHIVEDLTRVIWKTELYHLHRKKATVTSLHLSLNSYLFDFKRKKWWWDQ